MDKEEDKKSSMALLSHCFGIISRDIVTIYLLGQQTEGKTRQQKVVLEDPNKVLLTIKNSKDP